MAVRQIFGAPLGHAVSEGFVIPAVVDLSLQVLGCYVPSDESLLSADAVDAAAVDALAAAFELYDPATDPVSPVATVYDPAVLVALLVRFFGLLPHPVVPVAFYPTFLRVGAVASARRRASLLRILVHKLPPVCCAVIERLVSWLHATTISPARVAEVFAAAILRPTKRPLAPGAHLPTAAARVVAALVEYGDYIAMESDDPGMDVEEATGGVGCCCDDDEFRLEGVALCDHDADIGESVPYSTGDVLQLLAMHNVDWIEAWASDGSAAGFVRAAAFDIVHVGAQIKGSMTREEASTTKAAAATAHQSLPADSDRGGVQGSAAVGVAYPKKVLPSFHAPKPPTGVQPFVMPTEPESALEIGVEQAETFSVSITECTAPRIEQPSPDPEYLESEFAFVEEPAAAVEPEQEQPLEEAQQSIEPQEPPTELQPIVPAESSQPETCHHDETPQPEAEPEHHIVEEPQMIEQYETPSPVPTCPSAATEEIAEPIPEVPMVLLPEPILSVDIEQPYAKPEPEPEKEPEMIAEPEPQPVVEEAQLSVMPVPVPVPVPVPKEPEPSKEPEPEPMEPPKEPEPIEEATPQQSEPLKEPEPILQQSEPNAAPTAVFEPPKLEPRLALVPKAFEPTTPFVRSASDTPLRPTPDPKSGRSSSATPLRQVQVPVKQPLTPPPSPITPVPAATASTTFTIATKPTVVKQPTPVQAKPHI
jgi:hypothetical protein